MSQQYQLTGRLHELAAARKGEILFFREPSCRPASTRWKSAVFDGSGDRASTRVSTLEVPRAEPTICR